MSATREQSEILDTRRAALRALDRTVRAEMLAAAARWRLPGELSIALSVYDRVYGRTPRLGGHWTLFAAGVTSDGHEVATVTIAAEFGDEGPIDLWVSGADDVVAGGCGADALREALLQCDGPLRQRTPVCVDALVGQTQVPTLLVPFEPEPAFSLN